MEDTSGKVHRLADTTYRVKLLHLLQASSLYVIRRRNLTSFILQNNVELSAELHRLTTAAKAYHKAMQGEADG